MKPLECGETIAPPFLCLDNGRLRVEVASPARYHGARFCKSGFVTQATLRAAGRQHTFCVPELEHELHQNGFEGGAGLCGEFGIFAPIGYDEANVGEWFPKLGVGLLKRVSADPYAFDFPFTLEPFPVSVESQNQSLRFVTAPLPYRGYAARLEQKLALEDNRLIIDSRLENLGFKPLQTHEYRHNFLALDGAGVDEEMRLRLSFPVTFHPPKSDNAVLKLTHTNGHSEIRWREKPQDSFFQRFGGIPQNSAWWQLEWPTQGVGVREEVSAPLSRFHLFATSRLVSPEAFVDIRLEPGAVRCWRRTYSFFADGGNHRGTSHQD